MLNSLLISFYLKLKGGRANWKQNGKSSNEVIKNFEVAVNDPFITVQVNVHEYQISNYGICMRYC